MFAAVGSAGLGLTAAKYIAEFRQTGKQKAASIYGLTALSTGVTGIIAAAAIVVLAPYIAEKTLNAPYLTGEIRIGSLLLFITILNSVPSGALAGFEDFRAIAVNLFIASILEAVLMNLGAYWYGVPGAVLGFAAGCIALLVMNYASAARNFKTNDIHLKIKYISLKDAGVLYRFSLPAALSGIMTAPVLWLAKSMLVQKSGFDEAGIFEVADQWRMMILFIPGILGQVILPVLSSIKDEENNRYRKVIKYNVLINGAAALLLAAAVSLCGNFIMRLYGPGFNTILPLVLLVFSAVFTATSGVAGNVLASRSKMWPAFFINMFWGALLLVFAFIFLNRNMGASGLAAAILCSYIIFSAVGYIYLFVNMNKGA